MALRLGALALVFVLAIAARTDADEPAAPGAPAGPTPAERTEQVLATLPPPVAADAWSFEADLFINGKPAGGATFRLEVAQQDAATLWKSSETVEVRDGATQLLKVDFEATLDARLTAIRGKTVGTSPGGAVTFTWDRTPLGYGLRRKDGEKDEERVMLRDPPLLKASLGGLVRFLRAVPAEPAAYAAVLLVQDPNVGMTAEARMRAVTLEVEGLRRVLFGKDEREVWSVRRLDANHEERFLWFDPQDRSLLALVQPANRMEIVKKGLGPTSEAFDWKRPPKTALAAALQAARAFAVADVDALERLVWWPTLLAKLKAEPGGKTMDEPAIKAKLLAHWKATLKPHGAPEMIEPYLRSIVGEIKQEDAGEGRVRATFPATVQNLKLLLMPVEGVWYLAGLPGKP